MVIDNSTIGDYHKNKVEKIPLRFRYDNTHIIIEPLIFEDYSLSDMILEFYWILHGCLLLITGIRYHGHNKMNVQKRVSTSFLLINVFSQNEHLLIEYSSI